ncbi:MAG: TrmH family RNA methyltransferase [Prolixibacteraceae bacterium]
METNSVDFFKNRRYVLGANVKPPIIVAWKLRTPENYGNLLRLADTVGCEKVVFVGDEIQLSDRKIRKTAGDSFHRMPMEFVEEKNLHLSIPHDYSWIALETALTSTNIYKGMLPECMALFVGNEQRGIPSQVLERCGQIVHIPLTGRCTSLNVSHATAIALFEWVRQHL